MTVTGQVAENPTKENKTNRGGRILRGLFEIWCSILGGVIILFSLELSKNQGSFLVRLVIFILAIFFIVFLFLLSGYVLVKKIK